MNKRVLAAVTLVFLFIVLVRPAAAQSGEVEIFVSTRDITINTTETKHVNLIISNNQEIEDSFSISVWPSIRWAGITPNLEKYKTKKLAPGANDSIRLYFSIDSSADEIITTFLVTVNSITDSDVSDSDGVNVHVVRKTAVYISDLTLDNYVLDPGECVSITTTLSNFGSDSGPYKLKTHVRDSSMVLEGFEDRIEMIEGKSTKSVTNEYCFDKYATATTYLAESTLKTGLNKFVDSRSISFRVEGQSNLVYKKSVTYTPFAQIKTIKVKNEGNIVEHGFYVTETVSEIMSKFFYPEVEPDTSTPMDGKVTYKWLIDSLWPGEEKEIQYEIRFFSIWFSGLIIIAVVFFAFAYAYKPRIKKTVTLIGPLKRGKEIAVMLELRNSTIHEIKNIIVKDSLPSITHLVKRFDTIKPDIDKSEAGIGLTWKIKSLQPLEERVLTYRIKPSVEIVGSLRLPSATMRYVTKKKEKKTVASKSVEIK